MRIYDISQEVFHCRVFPGDPKPERQTLLRMADGAMYNLTAFRMCAHNGTHVDAPFHFIDSGKTIDQVDLSRFIGWAYVAEHSGPVTAADAATILEKARKANRSAAERILIKGPAVLTGEGAVVLAAGNGIPFLNALFETTSALGTVGLTADVTAGLSAASQIMIIIFMFFGRVGIMTISMGFMMSDRAEERIRFAETKLMIG